MKILAHGLTDKGLSRKNTEIGRIGAKSVYSKLLRKSR